MKTLAWIAIACLHCLIATAQEDSLTQIEYDTVIVEKPPVIINRKVLSIAPKVKPERQFFTGLSVGLNYFTSIYHTCKDCGIYDAYAKTVDSSQKETPGINVTAYLLRNLSQRLFYEATLGYSLYRERFKVEGVSGYNAYHQLGLSASLLYTFYNSAKTKLLIGIGGNAHYLLSASGQTVTIYQADRVMNINSFRTFNKLLGGVQLSAHWLSQVKKDWFILIHPEVAFEITSFTSYQEYYLQNRFLYALNFGLVKKM